MSSESFLNVKSILGCIFAFLMGLVVVALGERVIGIILQVLAVWVAVIELFGTRLTSSKLWYIQRLLLFPLYPRSLAIADIKDMKLGTIDNRASWTKKLYEVAVATASDTHHVVFDKEATRDRFLAALSKRVAEMRSPNR